MAVLRIDWTSMPKRLAHPKVVTGTSAEEPVKTGNAEFVKPLIIYIEDMAPSVTQVKGFDPINEIVLTEDKIVIAAKAFTCVRMTPEKAANDPILASVLKGDIRDATDSPSMLFVSLDMKIKKLQGDDITVSKVWEEMKYQFKKRYKGDLEKISKDMIKVLAELDKTNNERKVLNDKMNRASSASEKKETEKELSDLANREKGIIAERDKLIAMMK